MSNDEQTISDDRSGRPYDLAIVGGTVHTAQTAYRADVYVDGGKICDISAPGRQRPARQTIDARGLEVLPGLWHTHCHFRDPGFTDKEDFGTGTKAAALGGVTFCIEQPNTKPIPVTRETFTEKVEIAGSKAYVDFGINAGGLHPGEVAGLADAGAISVKIFNTRHVKDSYPYIPELNVVDHAHLYEMFEAAAAADVLVSIHPDDADWARYIVDREYIQKGRTTRADYEDSVRRGFMYGHGMVVGLATAAYYSELVGTRLYALHLGLMPLEGLNVVRDAKRHRSTPMFAEMELSAAVQTDAHAQKMGAKTFHVGREPKEEVWRAIADGTVDTLVLEHAPHTLEDIADGPTDHFNIPLGETGVQEFVPLLLTEVNNGNLTLQDVVRLCSEGPAKIFGVHPRKGEIRPGADADFTIIDMNAGGVFADEDMASKVGYTSWAGLEYTGRPEYTVVRGTVVMERGKVVGVPGYGIIAGPQR